MSPNELEQLLEQLIEGQMRKLERCADAIVPGLTREDLLQPNDYPELEEHPLFRYEEGVVEGLRTALAAVRAR